MESELRQIASQLEALKRVPETCVELQWPLGVSGPLALLFGVSATVMLRS